MASQIEIWIPHTFLATAECFDMVCFLALSVRLGHGTDKLFIIGAHNTGVSHVLIQKFANQCLGRFTGTVAKLLPISRECCLGWPIGYRKDHGFGRCCPLGRGCDSIGVLGDDTKIKLFLCLLGHRKT